MDTKMRGGIASGIKAIALLIVSIVITAAIAAAMLIDAVIAPAGAAPPRCPDAIHPVEYTIAFIDTRC